MDILKELAKQANNVMKDGKKKEKVGDAVEGVLKEVKKSVKSEDSKKMIDNIIKTVDGATSTKKKTTKNTKTTKKDSTKDSKKTVKKVTTSRKNATTKKKK